MSTLSADLLSPLRYFVLPVLLVVVGLVAASCHAGGGAGRFSAEPTDRTSARTAQGGSRELAPQGGSPTDGPAPRTGSRASGAPASTSPASTSQGSGSQGPGSSRPSSSVATAPGPSAPGSSAPGPSIPVPYQRLGPGECFDIDREAPGTVVRRRCGQPHDAQLVAVVRLTGDYRTDRDVRDGAAALCREPLRRKAAEQPYGTRWTTFVQYPYRSGYLLGSDTVACSLAAHTPDGGAGGAARKLTAPLQ
ncbi:hypothetical protein ABZX98_31205 [Streptomyces sp. NPDC002992]|uniref:hypothetical protein n=1 Tax=Streptomyces sp. NPDC002992 TaxID=3154273 RepID=UPI0033B57EE0